MLQGDGDDHAGKQSGRQKRVRFSDTTDVQILPLSDHDLAAAERQQRQTRLPGEDEGRVRLTAEQQQQQEPEAHGPIRSLDPVLAATRRARFRLEVSRMQLLEDTSMPDDLAAAEEDYDEPEELYNEGGIPIEPFHLRAEREEGYFDAEGNYLEYRLEADDTDAWLESIMDENRQVRADPELAARRRAAAAATAAGKVRQRQRAAVAPAAAAAAAGGGGNDKAEGEEEDDDGDADNDGDDEEGPYDMHMLDDTGPALDEEERAVYQKRIADLLQTGETPLDGLRRLGKIMHGSGGGDHTAEPAAAPAAGAGGGGEGTAMGPPVAAATAAAAAAVAAAAPLATVLGGGGSTATQLSCGERQRLRKQQRQQQQRLRQPDDGAGAVKHASGAGDGKAHQKEPLLALEAAAAGAVGAVQEPSKDDVGDVKMGEAEAPLEAEVPRRAKSPPSPLARQSAAEAAAVAAARRHSAVQLSGVALEARRQFDALTSYANLLLSAGQFDVYGSTREQLLRAAQRTLGVDVVRSLTVEGVRPVGRSRPSLGKTQPPWPAQDSTSTGKQHDGAGAGGAEGGGGGGGTAAAAAAYRDGVGGGLPSGSAAGNADAARVGGGKGGGGGAVTAVDVDVDMFGGDDEGDGGSGDDGGRTGSAGPATAADPERKKAEVGVRGAAARDGSNPPPATAAAASDGDRQQPSPQQQQPKAMAAAAVLSGSCGDVGAEASGRGEETGAAAAACERGSEEEAGPGGFVEDPSTGYMYSSDLGYYYDTVTGLYGDANTGLWYRYQAAEGEGEGGGGGRYELVTAVEQQQQQQQQQQQP